MLTIERAGSGAAPVLRVGGEGEEVTLPPALGSETVACDGTLTLEAREITIGQGVKIDGKATISTKGPGTPNNGIGGGAGHGERVTSQGEHIGGRGGDSGFASIGTIGRGGPGYGPDQGDTGSPGAPGTTPAVSGGRGGAAVTISATESVTIDTSATIDVSGGPGTSTDACRTAC